ncbi:hypothetical protein D3C84_1122370 [compost metagenome]
MLDNLGVLLGFLEIDIPRIYINNIVLKTVAARLEPTCYFTPLIIAFEVKEPINLLCVFNDLKFVILRQQKISNHCIRVKLPNFI